MQPSPPSILQHFHHLQKKLVLITSHSPFPSCSPPSPWQPQIFLSFWMYLFWALHVSGIIQYMVLCSWLLSLDVVFCFVFNLYFWLHWVFVAARRLSLVAAGGGCSSLRCMAFSLRWLFLLQNMGSRRAGFSSCGVQAQ